MAIKKPGTEKDPYKARAVVQGHKYKEEDHQTYIQDD